jgi:hypothetical protein
MSWAPKAFRYGAEIYGHHHAGVLSCMVRGSWDSWVTGDAASVRQQPDPHWVNVCIDILYIINIILYIYIWYTYYMYTCFLTYEELWIAMGQVPCWCHAQGSSDFQWHGILQPGSLQRIWCSDACTGIMPRRGPRCKTCKSFSEWRHGFVPKWYPKIAVILIGENPSVDMGMDIPHFGDDIDRFTMI